MGRGTLLGSALMDQGTHRTHTGRIVFPYEDSELRVCEAPARDHFIDLTRGLTEVGRYSQSGGANTHCRIWC